MKTVLLILSLFFFSLTISAQSDETTDVNEIEQNFNFTSGFSRLNSNLNRGVDLGSGSLFVFSTELTHDSGFYLNLTPSFSNGNWYDISSSAGYDHEFSDWFSMNAEYSYFAYSSETLNAYSSLNNLLSLSADFELPANLSLGFSCDYYPGTHSALNIGASFSGFYKIWSFSLLPMVTVDFINQEIENQFLKANKKQKTKNNGTAVLTTGYTSVSGLSSIGFHLILIYPLADHFKVVLHPLYQYTPKSEVSKSTSQFNISIGIKYSLDF